MSLFEVTKDGVVLIRTPTANYSATVESFKKDAGITGVNFGSVRHLYNNGPGQVVHQLFDETGRHLDTIYEPWPFAENWINRVADLVEAQTKREQTPPKRLRVSREAKEEQE